MLPHRVIVAVFLTLVYQGKVTSAIPLGSSQFDARGHIYGDSAPTGLDARDAEISERDLAVFLEPRAGGATGTPTTSQDPFAGLSSQVAQCQSSLGTLFTMVSNQQKQLDTINKNTAPGPWITVGHAASVIGIIFTMAAAFYSGGKYAKWKLDQAEAEKKAKELATQVKDSKPVCNILLNMRCIS